MMVNTWRSRFSGNLNTQDWWGYYNGKANTELVPQIWLKTYNSSIPGSSTSYRQYGSADRSINATAMQANMLTKVRRLYGFRIRTAPLHRFPDHQ